MQPKGNKTVFKKGKDENGFIKGKSTRDGQYCLFLQDRYSVKKL